MIRRWLARRRADRAALATMPPMQRAIVRACRIPPSRAHLAVVGTYTATGKAVWFGPLPTLAVMYPTPRERDQ